MLSVHEEQILEMVKYQIPQVSNELLNIVLTLIHDELNERNDSSGS